MWTNETIFSLGDMSHDEKLYEEFIEREYQGNYTERLEHLEHMITRLQFEQKKLKERLN